MADRKLQFGLIEAFSPHQEIVDCEALKCGRPIKFMDKCFMNAEDGSMYCKDCGICIRYERKKASQREALGLPEIKINGE